MNPNFILLKALHEPDYSRIEFWQQQQKESGFSEIVFWKQLNDSLDYYFNKINDELEKRNAVFYSKGMEAQITNFGLSLYNETNGELNADFALDNTVLIELRNKLLEWAESIKPFIYYYNYKQPNAPIQNTSLLKHYNFLFDLNSHSFRTELSIKEPEQISDFLDFHFRNFKRQYEKLRNWNELLAEWYMNTKKQMPATFTPQQKDKFLSWFEKENQKTPQKSNKITSPTKALFCNIVSKLEIIKKHETEGIDTYCKKVCTSFGIEYKDRVRQNFNNTLTQNAKKQIEELLLPLVDTETRNKIKDYLNKPKQK